MDSLYRHPELYDAEFGGYRADARFYSTVFQHHRGRVVELGCGTGRIYRHHRPVQYVGVDLEPAMLGEFHRHAAVPLVSGDMLAPPLRRHCAAVVVLAYNALQHLHTNTQLRASLVAAALLLEPDGVVALDLFMPPEPHQQRQDQDFGGAETRRLHSGATVTVLERSTTDAAGAVQTSVYRFARADGDAAVPPQEAGVQRRLWPSEAVFSALQTAGLVPTLCWGDVDGSPWSQTSPRLMLTAARAAAAP